MQVNQIQKKKRIAIIPIALLIILAASMFTSNITFAAKPVPVLLDPKTIPKYVNQLVVPPVYTPDSGTTDAYTVSMVTSTQQVLPTGTVLAPGADLLTNVWGYQGNATVKGATLATLGYPDGTLIPNFVWSPSATFETVKGTPITVKWINSIGTAQPFAVDPTLNWANPTGAFPEGDVLSAAIKAGAPYPLFPPGWDGTVSPLNPDGLNAQSPVPLVPHLHGAEVQSYFDGGPEAWWTSTGLKGPNYATLSATDANAAIYYYDNAQEPNTLWYHDHALGITRINVMSGLAGFYLLRDPAGAVTLPLTAADLDKYLKTTFPYGISEIPIAIQDRTFQTNGEFWYPELGINPTIHPYWSPEFFGDTIMVNGKVWPNLDVTPGWYRFRLLDGSNARFYTLSFDNKMPFTVIGADGGYLQSPTAVKEITIAPGERADVLVQFTPAMIGSKIILKNTAKAPFPNGAKADPQTTGQIMQFTVKDPTLGPVVTQGVTTLAALPASLNPTLPAGQFPTITAPAGITRRIITLNEVMGPAGPVMAVINGQYYNGVVTEKPINGTTEEWVIVNLTADAHPIHTHLFTFQLVSRQPFQAAKYNTAWLAKQIDPSTGTLLAPPFSNRNFVPVTLDPTPYLQNKPIAATPLEMTWKDTLQMNPGEVTTIRVRILQQDGQEFPFDASVGPGYVWHCHILEHEDNEMMRPLQILP